MTSPSDPANGRAKQTPQEEREMVLRAAYTMSVAQNLERIDELQRLNADLGNEVIRLLTVNSELNGVNNGLIGRIDSMAKTLTQMTAIMLDKLPMKMVEFTVEDLARLDGAEIENVEVDGRFIYHLKI